MGRCFSILVLDPQPLVSDVVCGLLHAELQILILSKLLSVISQYLALPTLKESDLILLLLDSPAPSPHPRANDTHKRVQIPEQSPALENKPVRS